MADTPEPFATAGRRRDPDVVRIIPTPGRPPPGVPDTSAAYGLLNGQPVGPVLPPAEPCEGCGADIWWTYEASGRDEDDPTHPVVTIRGVYERDPVAEADWSTAWALKRHECPVARGPSARRRTGLLTGEPLDDEDDDDPLRPPQGPPQPGQPGSPPRLSRGGRPPG